MVCHVTHNVSADTLLVDREGLHGGLHPVKAGGLPDKVDGEAMSTIHWDTFVPSKFKTDLVGNV